MNSKFLRQDFKIIFDVDAKRAEIQFADLEIVAYAFEWREDKGTYELIFGSSEFEGLFKCSHLMRDYLDLVLSELISYKQRVDRLLK